MSELESNRILKFDKINYSNPFPHHEESINFIRSELERLDEINNQSDCLQSDIQCEYLRGLSRIYFLAKYSKNSEYQHKKIDDAMKAGKITHPLLISANNLVLWRQRELKLILKNFNQLGKLNESLSLKVAFTCDMLLGSLYKLQSIDLISIVSLMEKDDSYIKPFLKDKIRVLKNKKSFPIEKNY